MPERSLTRIARVAQLPVALRAARLVAARAVRAAARVLAADAVLRAQTQAELQTLVLRSRVRVLQGNIMRCEQTIYMYSYHDQLAL